MKRIILAVLTVALWSCVSHAETFSIDPYHSSVLFSVKHVVGKVTGRFDKFSGTYEYDPNKLGDLSAQATIDVSSVNTGIEKRDNHLRSPDFFDVQKYPTMTFKSTQISDVNGNRAKLHGDLTLHGVTKPVVLDLEMAGIVKDPMGKGNRSGGSATGRLNRNDFGVGPATGPMSGMLGKDIDITIEIEGVSK